MSVQSKTNAAPVEAPGWLSWVLALPLVLIPLFLVYLTADFPLSGGYPYFILDEYVKYAAELFSVGLAIAVMGLYPLLRRWGPWLPLTITAPVLLFAAAVLLSLFQAVDLQRGWLVALQVYLLPVILFYLVASYRWRPGSWVLVVSLALLAGAVVAWIGIDQAFGLSAWAARLPHINVGSLLYSHNLAGEYLIILIPSAVALALMPVKPLLRLAAGLLGLLLLVYLVLTLARGAWVGLIGGALLTLVVASIGSKWLRPRVQVDTTADRGPKGRFGRLGLGLAALVPLFVVLVVSTPYWAGSSPDSGEGSPYVEELFSIDLSHTGNRLAIWNDSLEMLGDVWLGGVGPGHYKVAIPAYLDHTSEVVTWDERSGDFRYPYRPHNDYLQNWLELGLVGFIATGWLFLTITWVVARGVGAAVSAGDGRQLLMIVGPFMGFAAFAVSMLFEFPFRMPATAVLGWVMAGLAVAAALGDARPWRPLRVPTRVVAVLVLLGLTTNALLLAQRQLWFDVYFNEAALAWNDKRQEQGYEWQSRAFDYAPWNERVGLGKARMEMELGRYQSALATADVVLAHHPNSLPALWIAGATSVVLKRFDRVRSAFGTIVERFPYLPQIDKYRRLARYGGGR